MRLEADPPAHASAPWLLGALVLVLAIQQAALALLLEVGVPVGVVRLLRFTKEGILATLCVVASWQWLRSTRRTRLDTVDAAALAFVGFAAVYLVLGLVAGGVLFPGVTRDPWLHLVGFRSLATAPVVLLVARSVSSTRSRRAATMALVGVAVGSGVVAGVQMLAPDAWLALADRVFPYDAYQRAVFGRDLPDSVLMRTSFPGGTVVRAGGLMFDHLQLGFFLLPGFALVVSHAIVGRGRDVVVRMLQLVAIAIGMVATGTRSVLVAAAAVGATLVLGWPAGRVRRRALRVAFAAGVGLVALAIPTGVATRMVVGVLARDASSADRLSSLALGIDTIARRPWGVGVASTAETAARSRGMGLVVENAYLDIAVQLGVAGVLLFLGMLVLLGVALWRRRHVDVLALPGVGTLVGVGVGAMFLPVWLMFETSWATFMLAGLALPRDGVGDARESVRSRLA